MSISVKEAIAQLGGAETVAALLNAPLGSVHQWSSRSRVGFKYYIPFIDLCRSRRVPVDRDEVMRGPALNDGAD